MSPKVIVAQDLQSRAASVQQVLVRHGYETRLVHDGDSAIELARTWKPDAAVIDLGMQGRPALEVGTRLRKDFGGEIQLVGFTLPSAPEREDEALDAGFDHVVLEVGDAAEVLLALSITGTALVRRAQSSAFVFAATIIEHAFQRLRTHGLITDARLRGRNLSMLRRSVEILGRCLEPGVLEDERRAFVKFQLATVMAQVDDLARREQ